MSLSPHSQRGLSLPPEVAVGAPLPSLQMKASLVFGGPQASCQARAGVRGEAGPTWEAAGVFPTGPWSLPAGVIVPVVRVPRRTQMKSAYNTGEFMKFQAGAGVGGVL